MLCHEHRRAGFPIASLLLGTSNSNHQALSCHEKYDFENGTRKHTEESKNKMLQSLQSRDYSGDKNPFFGKKHTEESKNKMRQNMPDCSGDKNPFFGKKHMEQVKQKMRQNLPDLSGDKNPFFNKKHSVETRLMILAKSNRKAAKLMMMSGRFQILERNGSGSG
jgi:NUMOD3 motif-containing protein